MRPERRKKLIPVRLSIEALKELEILSIRTGKYRSELIREGIEDLLQKYKNLDKSKEYGEKLV